MGIQYIEDADRFLANEEGRLAWDHVSSQKSFAVADAVVSRDHDMDRGGIF